MKKHSSISFKITQKLVAQTFDTISRIKTNPPPPSLMEEETDNEDRNANYEDDESLKLL